MDIHKPKPVHGWRDFIKEIGSIVLGVSIALAAEQAVEWWHWKNQVAEAREAIAQELAGNIEAGLDQLNASTCAKKRLDALTTALDDATKSGQLPPIGDFRQAPLRGWPTGTWNSVLASQTAAHFPPAELHMLASLYDFIEHGSQMNGEQVNAWSDLHVMVGQGRATTPGEIASLRSTIARARMLDNSIGLVAARMYQRVGEQHVAFAAEDVEALRNAAANRNQELAWICRPPAAPHGGSTGALDDAPPLIAAVIKSTPPLTAAH